MPDGEAAAAEHRQKGRLACAAQSKERFGGGGLKRKPRDPFYSRQSREELAHHEYCAAVAWCLGVLRFGSATVGEAAVVLFGRHARSNGG